MDGERSLVGKVALVTGASRSIGGAIARRVAREGARVALVGRDREALETIAREIDGVAIVADVTETGVSDVIVAQAEATLGPIDLLVPNAGIEASAPLAGTSDEVWERLMLTNATSVFRLCRRVVPAMVERRRGRIVVIASSAGLSGYAYTTAYCASKHAVVGVVRAVAAEIARSGVTINAICPGFVDTDMTARSIERITATTGRDAGSARTALEKLSSQGRLLTPEEVAETVVMLAGDGARGIHGQAIAIGV